jgi:hypothetical protein
MRAFHRFAHLLVFALAGSAPSSAGVDLPSRLTPGILRANVPEFQLLLTGPAGERRVVGKEGDARVPAGVYTVDWWSATARDRRGRLWTVSGWKRPPPLIVAPGRVTRLRLAAPLRVSLLDLYRRPMLFTLMRLGPEGEYCDAITVDGQEPPRPRLRIRDAGGREIVTLSFDQG